MSFICSANATSYDDGLSEQKVHVIALAYFIFTVPERLKLAANLPSAIHDGTLPTGAHIVRSARTSGSCCESSAPPERRMGA